MQKRCATTIPDVETCFELVEGSAHCRTLISEQERYIASDQWEKMRPGRPSLSLDDFASLLKFIEESCQKQICSDGEKKQLEEYWHIHDSIRAQIKLNRFSKLVIFGIRG